MAYCGPHGIPLSAFLAWSEADQDAALAWSALEASRCPSCGTLEADWDEDDGGSRDAWQPQAHVCRGCELLESERARVRDDAPNMRGVSIRLARTDH